MMNAGPGSGREEFSTAMHVTYACSRCQQTVRSEFTAESAEVRCPSCAHAMQVPAGAFDSGTLRRCLVCPSQDLFLRKDFPQRLGVAIVVLGFIASSIAWGYYHQYLTFGILFAVALIDVVLYLFVPDALMCYRCAAMYRQVPGMEHHQRFDLTVHEKHRQQKARQAQHAVPGPASGGAATSQASVSPR